MSARDEGGPAFPQNQLNAVYGETAGMSLRDWFAGQALAGMCFRDGRVAKSYEQRLKERSKAAYGYADAMLAARQAKP